MLGARRMPSVALASTAGRAWLRGDLAQCAALLAEQRRTADGKPLAELVAYTASALLDALSGRVTTARTHLAAAEQRLHACGVAAFGPRWDQAALVCDWMGGDWTAGVARSARLAELPPEPVAITRSLRVELLRETGQSEAAALTAKELDPTYPMAAWALAGSDPEPATALAALRTAAGSSRSGLRPLLLLRMTEIAYRAGETAIVERAYADLRELGRDDPLTTVTTGIAAAYATHDAEPAQSVQAVAQTQGMSALVADCLTVRGRVGGDSANLRSARDRWRSIGAVDRASEISALLGDGPPRLTPRERELVGLIRDGHGNREIAKAMHLSVKTVEAYLTRVYGKTGCTSRLELAAAAADGRIAER